MSKLTSLIRRAPKRFSASVLMVAAAVIVPAIVLAWGPDRPTFTVENPATYNTFNSITNNPHYGDERNFVRIKDAADTGPGNWKDEINVDSNKEYLVQMYVHNNAGANLNKVAENVKVMANVPNTTGKQIQIDGFVTSSNATPNKIWDQAIFKSSQDFNLTYVPGSAVIYNNAFGQAGAKLSDNIVTSNGATIGYDKLDGKIPGCFEYAGYVSFKVKAQVGGVLNFTTEKLVSKKGENKWVNDYKAQPGETVDYLLEYKNVGTVQQDNVVIRDILPANMSYVNGTTVLGNANAPAGKKVSDNVTKDGINTGSYLPGGNAWITFSAKVAEKDALPCGTTKLVNKVHTSTGGYYKEDDANVTVDKECKPTVKYTCDSLAVKKLTDTKVQFTTNYTVENATFKNVTYVIRNASGAEIDRKVSTAKTLEYTQTTPGKYTVQAIVTVTVDGQDKTVTSQNCKGEFEIEKKVVVKYTCNALEVKSLSRTEFRFSTAYSVENATFKSITYVVRNAAGTVVDTITATTNSSTYTQSQAGSYTVQATVHFMVNGVEKTATNDKCKGSFKIKDLPKEITVCELATKKIVTIKESEFNPAKYSKNLDDCKEAPKTIEVCEIATKKIVTINESDMDSRYTTDLSKCEEPVVPPELPQTGTTENIVAIVGLGAMIASIAYYAASRRALNQ